MKKLLTMAGYQEVFWTRYIMISIFDIHQNCIWKWKCNKHVHNDVMLKLNKSKGNDQGYIRETTVKIWIQAGYSGEYPQF
jgi:hypothetical protein